MQSSWDVAFDQTISHGHSVSKGLRRALNTDHAVGVSGATAQFRRQVSGMSNQKLVSLFDDRKIAIS